MSPGRRDGVLAPQFERPPRLAYSSGSMERIRFRFGKNGHYLELQLPLAINGDPRY